MEYMLIAPLENILFSPAIVLLIRSSPDIYITKKTSAKMPAEILYTKTGICFLKTNLAIKYAAIKIGISVANMTI